MDKTVINKHYEILAKYYPSMNITQLGMVCGMLGVIRASMGTVDNYIHPEGLSAEVRECLDFIQREIMGIKKSRIDIDYWNTGNKGGFRRDYDLKRV